MPVIESIRESQGQIIARVFVERSEVIRHGDLLPYFQGKRYRALGHMTLIEGEDWRPAAYVVPEGRLVEVVVAEWGGPPKTEAREVGRPKRAPGAPDQLSLPAPSQAKRRSST